MSKKFFDNVIVALCALVLVAVIPVTAYAATVLAASNDALYAAVKNGHPGDTILVGFSGTADVENLSVAAPGVIIKPDPSKTAVLDRIIADGSSGLTFTGFEVACDPKANWRSCTYAGNASRIVFDNLHVHTKDGSYTGGGFSFRNTTDSAVTNSRFDHLGVGGGPLTSQRISITGNIFSDINTDGIDVASSCYVDVSKNRFLSFHPDVGAHPDAIQLWNVSVYPLCPVSIGNTIRDNDIRRGDGTVMQGIFAEAQSGLIVTGNAMTGTMFNGISFSGIKGGEIGNNFVQGFTDDCGGGNQCFTRIIVRGTSSNIIVHDNTTQAVGQYLDGGAPNPGYTETNNKIIQPTAKGDYSQMDAWLAAKNGVVTPPVVTPPVDPRDAQIVTLTAQVANLNTQVATLTAAANDNATKLAAANAATAAVKASLVSVQTQLATVTAQVAPLQTQVTTLTAKIAKAVADLN